MHAVSLNYADIANLLVSRGANKNNVDKVTASIILSLPYLLVALDIFKINLHDILECSFSLQSDDL